jgi:hypothetical protein
MENSELIKIEEEMDEMAQVRADVLLLKKIVEKQQSTHLPQHTKLFYVVVACLMACFVCIEFIEQRYIMRIYKTVATISELIDLESIESITPTYENN